jgi:hypothetical protein
MKDLVPNITEEAEERNAREAKQVEASDFHSGEAGSSPVASTKDMKNWFKINCTTIAVAGRDMARLSVFQ